MLIFGKTCQVGDHYLGLHDAFDLLIKSHQLQPPGRPLVFLQAFESFFPTETDQKSEGKKVSKPRQCSVIKDRQVLSLRAEEI